jgi:hypothetical protein
MSITKPIPSERVIFAVPRRVVPQERIPILAREKVKFYSENVFNKKKPERDSTLSTMGISNWGSDIKSKRKNIYLQNKESQFGLSFTPDSLSPTKEMNASTHSGNNITDKPQYNLKEELESALHQKPEATECNNSPRLKLSNDFATIDTQSDDSFRHRIQRCPNPISKFLASIDVPIPALDLETCDLEDSDDEGQPAFM